MVIVTAENFWNEISKVQACNNNLHPHAELSQYSGMTPLAVPGRAAPRWFMFSVSHTDVLLILCGCLPVLAT